MKENFMKRRLVGTLNVACKFEDGTVRMWQDDKAVVVQRIQEIVEYYQSLGHRMTLRQLHYQFVGRNWIVNHDTAYKKLGKILDDCRYNGLVDWNNIEDRGRVPYLPYYVHDIPDAIKDTVEGYRLDRQLGQENHIEVWTEKDALSGIMKKAMEPYGCRLVVNKGYTSSSAIHKAYERFSSILDSGKEVTILYFGDHDPSGLDMVRDIRERLEFMFENGVRKPEYEGFFNVVPIGLTMKQIKKYKLPPNPAKMTDGRSAAYIEKFGKMCWEVDALDLVVLGEIIVENIVKYMDMEQYDTVLLKEEKDKKQLITKTKKIKWTK